MQINLLTLSILQFDYIVDELKTENNNRRAAKAFIYTPATLPK